MSMSFDERAALDSHYRFETVGEREAASATLKMINGAAQVYDAGQVFHGVFYRGQASFVNFKEAPDIAQIRKIQTFLEAHQTNPRFQFRYAWDVLAPLVISDREKGLMSEPLVRLNLLWVAPTEATTATGTKGSARASAQAGAINEPSADPASFEKIEFSFFFRAQKYLPFLKKLVAGGNGPAQSGTQTRRLVILGGSERDAAKMMRQPQFTVELEEFDEYGRPLVELVERLEEGPAITVVPFHKLGLTPRPGPGAGRKEAPNSNNPDTGGYKRKPKKR